MPGMGEKSREEDKEACPCGASILEGEGRPLLTKTTVGRAAEFRGENSGEAGTSGDWVTAVLHVARRIPASALSVMPASGGLQQRCEMVCCGLSKTPARLLGGG